MSKYWLVGVAVAALMTSACTDSAEEKRAKELAAKLEASFEKDNKPPENIEEAFAQLGKALNDVGDGTEAMAARDLKNMLPDSIAGLKRKSHSAKKSGAFGFSVSVAEGVYAGDDGTINLSITDLGSVQSLADIGMDWLDMEVDEETDQGFSRTTEFKGHRAIQSFRDTGGTTEGQMIVMIDGRFTIDATGYNVPFEKIEEAFTDIPVEDMARLARKQ